MRCFCMGNAPVVDVVKRIGDAFFVTARLLRGVVKFNDYPDFVKTVTLFHVGTSGKSLVPIFL